MARASGGVLVVAAVLVVGGCFFMSSSPSGTAEADTPKDGKTDFARDRSPIPFDGQRAMEDLVTVCKIGPRVSGSEGMKKQQELLKKHFEELGARVEFQRFSVRQISRKGAVEMANMVVTWHPDRERRVLLCCHYDTRPIADQEPDRRKWTEPFLSANDGGSGVALLMEFGRHMKDFKTNVGIDFAFFDGEEYIFDRNSDKYFFGSEHFASAYSKGKPKYKYVAAILLDMIGGKNAVFPAEANSYFKAGPLVEDVWKVAGELRCKAFLKEIGPTVDDDHLALNAVGIPAIDIIDFSYPHWHRLSDTPENCSAESLDQVARVLAVWLARLK